MSEQYQELSADDLREIKQAPAPFEELATYHGEPGLYELDRRPEAGYEVVLLFNKLGKEALSTVVEKRGKVVVEVKTPADRGLDRLHHTFPNAPEEEVALLFPPKITGQIAA
jgi:hypothetical protein